MKMPFFSQFVELPLIGFQEHAEKVKECAWAFQQAMECYFAGSCDRFEEYLGEVDRLESEADEIKIKIRATISRKAKMTLDKFQLFIYIQEQDKVLDCVEDCLNWVSYRPYTTLDDELKKGFFNLVDSVITPIEELSFMVVEARKYFDNFSMRQREIVKDVIRNLHKCEHDSDGLEAQLKLNIFKMESDPIAVFHLVELADRIGSIADHAENTGDMMRAMLERE
jgi:predicted phosphate transport protein (TIGR00153 family)